MALLRKIGILRFFAAFLICILTGAEMDLFTPSFPELAKVFNLTPFMVELTLSVNFIAYCICCLYAGTLSDRYGRRPLILFGLLIFVGGSLLCILASNFSILLLGRFLQGIGISGPAVLCYIIVLDQCSPQKKPAVLALLDGITTIAIAFSPILGSYLTFYFNWQANFILLLCLGLLCWIISFLSIPSQKRTFSMIVSLSSYSPLLKSVKLWVFVGVLCCLEIPYWIFSGISPLLYMESMEVSLKSFGFYQGIIGFVYAIFCILSFYLFKKLGHKFCFYSGVILCCIGAFFLMGISILNIQTPWLITGGMIVLVAGIVFPINIFYPFTIDLFKHMEGRTAALIVCLRLVTTAFFLELVSSFYEGRFFPTGLTFFLMILTALFLIQTIIRNKWIVLKGT